MTSTVHLGFAVGTGEPVEIPLAHTFVTGQTQLSGKTTTLRAIVERSGRCALAFVTKRGERFDGPRIPPYLPREDILKPISWRLVETILASALGQRQMKYERLWIVNAAKGARSLVDVRANVTRLQAKAKAGTPSGDMYMLLGEYLDLVLPEMQALRAADQLQLRPGLNVMDLSGVGGQLQALVIRAALERINLAERDVLTVFPEAWEFAPRGRSAPAKDEAIAMARKGAVLRNYLLCDSQDLAGVETVIRQAASVWILGVQRELNELKRTLQMIPAGIQRPKAEDVATLDLGQFWVCYGRHAIKTYVQPASMSDSEARAIATGAMRIRLSPMTQQEDTVTSAEADRLRTENLSLRAANDRLQAEVNDLAQRLATLEGIKEPRHDASRRTPDRTPTEGDGQPDRDPRAGTPPPPPDPSRRFTAKDDEEFYQAVRSRLFAEAGTDPTLLKVLTSRPELVVEVERRVVTADGDSYPGRLGRMIVAAFFDQPRAFNEIVREMERTGPRINNISVNKALAQLLADGFLTKEAGAYQAVAGMKVRIVERSAA